MKSLKKVLALTLATSSLLSFNVYAEGNSIEKDLESLLEKGYTNIEVINKLEDEGYDFDIIIEELIESNNTSFSMTTGGVLGVEGQAVLDALIENGYNRYERSEVMKALGYIEGGYTSFVQSKGSRGSQSNTQATIDANNRHQTFEEMKANGFASSTEKMELLKILNADFIEAMKSLDLDQSVDPRNVKKDEVLALLEAFKPVTNVILTDDLIQTANDMLDEGYSVEEVKEFINASADKMIQFDKVFPNVTR